MNQSSNDNYRFCTLNDSSLIKNLPSLHLVQILQDICQVPVTFFEYQQPNRYDRKNHILYINNFNSYATLLKQKYNRTVASFQKQLKMIGFKKRKCKQHLTENYTQSPSQPSKIFTKYHSSINLQQNEQKPLSQEKLILQNQGEEQKQRKLSLSQTMKEKNLLKHQSDNMEGQKVRYMLIWKTNRMGLIEKEMQDLQETLEIEVERAIRMKEEIQSRRKNLDRKMETLVLASLVEEMGGTMIFGEIDTNQLYKSKEQEKKKESTPINKSRNNHTDSSILRRHLEQVLCQLKNLSNLSQYEANELVKKVSKCSESELELYRALIYKQTHVHRSIEDQEE